MAGISGSKKVSRAARTGGSSRRKGESPLGFYALLALLVLVGSGTVFYSREERLSATTPNNTAPLEPVTNTVDPSKNRAGDRWYQAYGLYICDKFVPNITKTDDPYGLSTKSDGILYIHPATKADAGQNATLGRFADAMGTTQPAAFTLGNDSITVDGDETTYTTGETKCGDQTGELVVKEWIDPTKPDEGTILRHEARTIRVKNGAAVTIAFVPEGKEDIPLPESATNGALAAAPGKDTGSAATDPAAAIDPAAAADPAAVDPATTVAPTVTTAPAEGQ